MHCKWIQAIARWGGCLNFGSVVQALNCSTMLCWLRKAAAEGLMLHRCTGPPWMVS